MWGQLQHEDQSFITKLCHLTLSVTDFDAPGLQISFQWQDFMKAHCLLMPTSFMTRLPSIVGERTSKQCLSILRLHEPYVLRRSSLPLLCWRCDMWCCPCCSSQFRNPVVPFTDCMHNVFNDLCELNLKSMTPPTPPQTTALTVCAGIANTITSTVPGATNVTISSPHVSTITMTAVTAGTIVGESIITTVRGTVHQQQIIIYCALWCYMFVLQHLHYFHCCLAACMSKGAHFHARVSESWTPWCIEAAVETGAGAYHLARVVPRSDCLHTLPPSSQMSQEGVFVLFTILWLQS